MFFQKVIKGVVRLNRAEAHHMVTSGGITCNWWRQAQHISPAEQKEHLIAPNVLHHLNHYDDPLPPGHNLAHLGRTYGDVTPFISTTAGAIQRDAFYQRNILFDPFLIALGFATNNFTTSGFLFYAYVITLGKQAVELEQFAEEVRELHIYTQYLPYHHEGEIMAKIIIPAVQIERAEEYDGPTALAELRRGRTPSPVNGIIINNDYAAPTRFANVRELL